MLGEGGCLSSGECEGGAGGDYLLAARDCWSCVGGRGGGNIYMGVCWPVTWRKCSEDMQYEQWQGLDSSVVTTLSKQHSLCF